MNIQVLVTTMHQTGFEKFSEMNLQTDAVIANQTDKNEYLETVVDNCSVKLVSTDSRGLSRNRNIALSHANQNADFIIFSDDDLVFNDGYEKLIIDEFEKHPEAEAIKFNIHDLSKSRKISMKQIQKFEKATKRNMSSSGVCGLVIKSDTMKRYNLHFHENFGSGSENYCGEDTIFLMEMIEKKIQFYRSPVDIAGIDQTESTWFIGHNERFFYTAGMVIGTIYPHLSYLIVLRSAFKAYRRKDSNMSFMKIISCYYKGIRGSK